MLICCVYHGRGGWEWWGGVSQSRAFEYCCLLWCNTRATDKSELMNGNLWLTIVKARLSPHAASGNLSATRTLAPAQTPGASANQLLTMATSRSISSRVTLHHRSLFCSLRDSDVCFHELILPSSFLFRLPS